MGSILQGFRSLAIPGLEVQRIQADGVGVQGIRKGCDSMSRTHSCGEWDHDHSGHDDAQVCPEACTRISVDSIQKQSAYQNLDLDDDRRQSGRNGLEGKESVRALSLECRMGRAED